MNKLFTMNVSIPLIVFWIYKLWGDFLYVEMQKVTVSIYWSTDPIYR